MQHVHYNLKKVNKTPLDPNQLILIFYFWDQLLYFKASHPYALFPQNEHNLMPIFHFINYYYITINNKNNRKLLITFNSSNK